MGRVSLAVCGLLIAAPNCPDLYSLATHGFTVPSLNAANGTAAADPAGLRVNIQFTATNPNPFPISLSGVDYQVALSGEQVFAGSVADPEVAEHATSALTLTGVVDPRRAVYRTLRPAESMPYTLTGTAHVNSPAGVPIDVEFQANGTFVVPSNLPAPQ